MYIYMAYMNYVGCNSVLHYPSYKTYNTKDEAVQGAEEEMWSSIKECYEKDHIFTDNPEWDGDSFKYNDRDHDFLITVTEIR